MNTLFKNGYILLSRKLLESEIWSKPPLYVKVWIYLLSRAQHQNYKGLKRGQLLTSIPEIREAMVYKVGYRVEKPTKKQIWGVLDWLRNPYEGTTKGTTDVTTNEPMIVTTKVTHGILVNIVKYDLYQTSQNYEGNNEGNDEGNNEGIAKELRRERQGHNINKNDKNDKNDKNISNIDFSNHNFSDIAKSKIEEWLTYKKERRENYKPTGLKSLLTQIENNISTYGEQKVIDLISECMAAGYKGIIWDKLKKPQYKQDKLSNRNNFEQRDYDEEFYKKLEQIGG